MPLVKAAFDESGTKHYSPCGTVSILDSQQQIMQYDDTKLKATIDNRWSIQQGMEASGLIEGLDWRCLARVLECEVDYAFRINGANRSLREKNQRMGNGEDRLKEFGYLGIWGGWDG